MYKLNGQKTIFSRNQLYSSATNFTNIRLYQPDLLKSSFIFPALLDSSLSTKDNIPEICINILFIRISISYRIYYHKFGQTELHETIAMSFFHFTPADNIVVPLFFPLLAKFTSSYLEKVTGVARKIPVKAVYTENFTFHASNIFVTEIELPEAPAIPDFIPLKKGNYYRFYIALFDCHRFETAEYQDKYENMTVQYRVFWILGYFGGSNEYELQWYPVYYDEASSEDSFNRSFNRFTISISEKKSLVYHPVREVVLPVEILTSFKTDAPMENFRDVEGNPGLYIPDAKISVSFLNF